jgi:hypothetical protein
VKKLETKQKKLLDEFLELKDMIRGSISSVCSGCNRANCICDNKEKSRAYRMTYKGKDQSSKIVYIPKSRLKETKKLISNYKKNKEIIDQLIDVNVEIFKKKEGKPK